MFVVNFEQVNAPEKRLMSLQCVIEMLKVNNKNTRKKCEICPGGNYSEKNIWGEFHGEKFSEWGLLPR